MANMVEARWARRETVGGCSGESSGQDWEVASGVGGGGFLRQEEEARLRAPREPRVSAGDGGTRRELAVVEWLGMAADAGKTGG